LVTLGLRHRAGPAGRGDAGQARLVFALVWLAHESSGQRAKGAALHRGLRGGRGRVRAAAAQFQNLRRVLLSHAQARRAARRGGGRRGGVAGGRSPSGVSRRGGLGRILREGRAVHAGGAAGRRRARGRVCRRFAGDLAVVSGGLPSVSFSGGGRARRAGADQRLVVFGQSRGVAAQRALSRAKQTGAHGGGFAGVRPGGRGGDRRDLRGFDRAGIRARSGGG